MPANGTLEFAIECAKMKKMKAVEDAQRAALSTAKLKASQLHQVALLETAQRRNDVAAVSKNIATGVATLSAKPVTSGVHVATRSSQHLSQVLLVLFEL